MSDEKSLSDHELAQRIYGSSDALNRLLEEAKSRGLDVQEPSWCLTQVGEEGETRWEPIYRKPVLRAVIAPDESASD